MLRKYIFLLIIISVLNTVYSNTIHILQKGETLYQLSKTYNISVESLIETNSIKNISSVKIGTKIIIPNDIVKHTNYTVLKGDTLYNISKKFNLPLSRLLEFNNMKDGSIIHLGFILKVPNFKVETKLEYVNVIPDVLDVKGRFEDDLSLWPLLGNVRDYSGRIKGVEIDGNAGEYIKVVSPGKVIWYDSFKGIGKVVLIEGSNGYDYLYGSKDNLNVKVGQNVSVGERIGRLESNNTSIIFSVFKNGKPMNNISMAPR